MDTIEIEKTKEIVFYKTQEIFLIVNVGELEDGTHIAYRNDTPSFCFIKDTEEELLKAVQRMYDSYLKLIGE